MKDVSAEEEIGSARGGGEGGRLRDHTLASGGKQIRRKARATPVRTLGRRGGGAAADGRGESGWVGGDGFGGKT